MKLKKKGKKMININKDLSEIPKSLKKEKSYKNPDVKIDLKELYNSKCCYCEDESIDGEVEHFRPKSKYPWLKNDWQNLLWACHKCNNIKSAKLPVAKKIAVEPDNVNVCNEKEELIMCNPEYINPEKFIKFDKTGKINSENEQMKKTIEICKLDRRNLNIKRIKIYNDLLSDIDDFEFFVNNKKDIRAFAINKLIKEIKNNKSSFIVFRKYIIKNWLADMLK